MSTDNLFAAVQACRTSAVITARLKALLPAATANALTVDLPEDLGRVAELLEKRALGFGIQPDGIVVALQAAGPLAEPVQPRDGATVLTETRDFIGRFCVFPDEFGLTTAALWAAHAHMVEHFHTTPRLAVLSPEPSSGKTRVLEVLNLLVPYSQLHLSPSAATIFRKLAVEQITLLLDETDTIFKVRGRDENNEDLRGLLNSGYRRGSTIPRCVGPRHEVVDFPVFCAVALAGLGDLPDTILSRSIIIRMRRRAPNESVEQFRIRIHEPQGHAIRARLVEWAKQVGTIVGMAWPSLPKGLVDRAAEIWEPLIAIADAAGGDWPQVARSACTGLCSQSQYRRASLGIRLLADLRTIFGDAIAMHTETIIERLIDGAGLDEDAPWASLNGQPIGKRGLATLLKRYEVCPQKVTVAGRSLQGYRREHLFDVWTRYLPPPGSGRAEHAESSASIDGTIRQPVPGIPDMPDVRQGESGSEWVPV